MKCLETLQVIYSLAAHLFCGLKNKMWQHPALVIQSQMGMKERLEVDFLTWVHFDAQHEYPLMEETKEMCVLALYLATLVCWCSVIIKQ